MEIRFNLSADEFEMLRECAESKRVSMEILIREAILHEIEDDIDSRVDMLLTARKKLERDKVYGNIEVSDLLDI